MLRSENLKNIKLIPITDVTIGMVLVNLGEVLEIDPKDPGCVDLVISRMKQKQVINFDLDDHVVII
jgi:hypothetical protein